MIPKRSAGREANIFELDRISAMKHAWRLMTPPGPLPFTMRNVMLTHALTYARREPIASAEERSLCQLDLASRWAARTEFAQG